MTEPAAGTHADRRFPADSRSIAGDARALHERLGRPGTSRPGSAGPPPLTLGADPQTQRHELYVLLAVALDHVVRDFVAATPLRALAAPRDLPASVALCEALLQTFDAFFVRSAERWRGGDPTSSIAPLLERIDRCGPGVSGVLDYARPRYAEHLMRAGMTTMAMFAPPIFAAAVQLSSGAGGAMEPAAAELARASGQLPARLAALGLEEVAVAQRELIDPETMEFLTEDVLRRVEGSRGARLELTRGLPRGASYARRWASPPSYAHRIGCPTLVRFDAHSAMDRLWAWTVDAAHASGYFARRIAEP